MQAVTLYDYPLWKYAMLCKQSWTHKTPLTLTILIVTCMITVHRTKIDHDQLLQMKKKTKIQHPK